MRAAPLVLYSQNMQESSLEANNLGSTTVSPTGSTLDRMHKRVAYMLNTLHRATDKDTIN
jgi:hypothetical protein